MEEKLTFSSFIRSYNQLYKETDLVYRNLAKDSGISECMFWILYYLREHKDTVTQTELVAELSLSKQTIHSALKSAQELGILQLKAIPGNRKSKAVVLTPAGEALAVATADRTLRVEERAFCALKPEERAELLRLERIYLQALQNAAAEERKEEA